MFKKIFPVVLVVLVFISLISFRSRPASAPINQDTITVTQEIISPDSQPNKQTFSASSSDSVLDLLKRTQTVTTKDYDFGTLVESINGVTNGTDSKYWLYQINGKAADVGASQYKLQDKDIITWEFKAYEQ